MPQPLPSVMPSSRPFIALFVTVAALHAQNWTQLAPSPSPLGREHHAMAYDAATDRAVLFGGQANGNFLPPQTWEWTGAHWLQYTPATAPAPRESPAMAYDAVRSVSILFGGLNSSGIQGDTWQWSNGTWTQRTPPASPPARYLHAMAWDPVRSRVVLFGGFGGSALNDVWEWDGTTWSHPLRATAPPPRWGMGMAFDGARTVMFGGFDNVTVMGDTWLWDGTAWTHALPASSPSARYGYAMSYDPTRSRALLFGGYHQGDQGDTWSWDGSNWTQLLPAASPQARTGAAMACDPRRGSTILFGGSLVGNAVGDTWVHALASARSFGSGCGAPVLVLQASNGSLPVLGQSFQSSFPVPPATTAAFVAAGFSDRAIGTTPLPLDLAAFGMPGCTLYQDLAVLALPCQLAGGTASHSLSIPSSAGLAGLRVFLQGWALAAGANAAGIVTSNGLEVTVGS